MAADTQKLTEYFDQVRHPPKDPKPQNDQLIKGYELACEQIDGTIRRTQKPFSKIGK